MCGIIGFTGEENCVPLLLNALSALEYRGYDSAGIAYRTDSGIKIIKTSGKIQALREKIAESGISRKNHPNAEPISSDCGIGHTRWATHGIPSDTNAHPHRAPGLNLVLN